MNPTQNDGPIPRKTEPATLLERFTPDPFLLALGLTLIVGVLALNPSGVTASHVIRSWYGGLWSLLAFSMQMALVLLLGYLVACSKPAQRVFAVVVTQVHGAGTALIVTTLFSVLTSWLNWGFGLVVGAFLAVEMAKKIPHVNFRWLVAGSYGGFIVWHGGLSGSIPLAVNTAGGFSEKLLGHLLPAHVTIFSAANLTMVSGLLILMPATVWYFGSKTPSSRLRLDSQHAPDGDLPTHASTPAERLEQSRWPCAILALLIFAGLVLDVTGGTFSLDLSRVCAVLFAMALIAQGQTRALLRSAREGAPQIIPVILQYPLYGGIMGIMTGTPLASEIATLLSSAASAQTFPVLTFWSAGLLNLFIPSGGGQWAVQGPIVLPAAQTLGADIPLAVMAVAWGDAWTNLAQPFWALPVLAIAGLQVRDIIGPCLLLLAVSGAFLSVAFYFFA